ncbi:ABC transporter ATP-binding protein [Aurantimonas sp. A3-2-R12]|uniref:ABC transporter ATP-binding protein n=1 Tax=Aurantimonas sp. A3-2-R12 TaxID=3114362 RepID=UPI002E197329|nr:ABC transporter ATP-binding protein [Aurantimonas sp. A3-2-R12]
MIRLENLTKVFETPNGPIVAADRINLDVPRGEICILLGPSGCGKTTALKMINRLIPHTSGKVYIDGEDTDKIDTVELRRRIGYVIQQIGLFPNMTVEENICVVPKLLGWDMTKARKRAAELLELVALDPAQFLKRYPKELSGGQQQRIGVIRGLAADPPVMLMDEPFGAIDPINREIIQDEFLKMQAELNKTIMFVSHDIDEAVKMGDKIAIFRAGKLEQYDNPDNILAHPANEFIAEFVGADRTLKRLRLVTAAEAMDPEAPVVSRHTTTADAAAIMREREMDFAVVLDAEKRPTGYLTIETATQNGGNVAEVTAPLLTTVRENADLRTVVSEMFTHDRSWVACVDAANTYQGVITQSNIKRVLGETYRAKANGGEAHHGR